MMATSSEASKGAPVVAIRKLAKSDVPTVWMILQESPEAAAWSQESLLQLASADPAGWVAELNGLPVGFLIGRIAADEFEILNLAVAAAHRRNGIASKLLESALEFSRNVSCVSAYLEVRVSNVPAIKLYTHHGFTESGRRVRYYRHPVEDALVLSLNLSGNH